MLQGHQPLLALLGHLRCNGIGKVRGGGALFWRKGENAHVVELLFRHKVQQVLEVVLGLAGKAHDEGGAQHSFRELLANPFEQASCHVGLPGAVHGAQHLRVAVLQRQIEVGQHVGHLPIGSQHLGGEARGVGVVHPNPGDFHLPEGPQQLGELGFSIDVEAVVGGDLADQHQFLHPLARQGLGFGHDRFDRAGTLVAAQLGDDAEGAAVVAAFSHLEVGHRFTGGAVAGQMLIAHEGGVGTHLVHPLAGFDPLQHAHDVLVIARSHNGFGFRERLEELLLEVLG